jgi:enterochelin esterase family protein
MNREKRKVKQNLLKIYTIKGESKMLEDFQLLNLKNFYLEQIRIKSDALKSNALGDPTERTSPCLVPKSFQSKKLPLVLVLAGFTGNGPKYLGPRGFEDNMAEQIDKGASKQKAPKAIYVFVDAFSFWGGSQFINSAGVGNYEDYIVKELFPSLLESYPIDTKKVMLMGVSSGGYGALHLASKYPEKFNHCAALAPDSYFETCYLGDLYKASPYLLGKSYNTLISEHKKGKILARRDGHSILNAIGMTACYSAKSKKKIEFPIDLSTGLINKTVWKKWKDQDPVNFLVKRHKKVAKLKEIYLEVGVRDQFHLYFGARQMHQALKDKKIRHHYNEFNGTHFDFAERRPVLWEWLNKKWKAN